MGTVYAAVDRLLELPVALKFVRPHLASDPREQSRLWREVRLAQATTHVNVVRTFTLEEHGEHLFIVMELLDGVSLADRLREGPLPVDEVIRIGRGVLAGLAAAHARSIVHRDVKPQNTRLCADGRVVVMDFGIARTAQGDAAPAPAPDAAPDMHTVLAGTPGYIAPEVLARAPATAASDLYAVGVMLYEMLTGRRPSDTRTASAAIDPSANASAAMSAPQAASLPPSFARLVERLLAAEPAARPTSAQAVIEALDAIARGDAATGASVVKPRRLAAAGAALAIGAALVAVLSLSRTGGLDARPPASREPVTPPSMAPGPSTTASAPAAPVPDDTGPPASPSSSTSTPGALPAATTASPKRSPRRRGSTHVRPTTPTPAPASAPVEAAPAAPPDSASQKRLRDLNLDS